MPDSGSISGGSKLKVLVCDDSPAIARLAARVLSSDGYDCEVCATSKDVLRALEAGRTDIVLADVETSVGEILPQLRARHPGVALIALASSPAAAAAVDAVRRGAFDYLTKPFDESTLSSAVGRAAEVRRLRNQNSALRRQLHSAAALASFVAESAAARQLLALVHRAARVGSPVLIEGETGAGKTLVADLLHYFSPRAEQPLVTLNCKATPLASGPDAGHLHSSCRMALAQAPRGTLLLKEIAEASNGLQAEIASALEEAQSAPHDVRLLASSSRPLAALVDAGEFRRDLFFMVNVIPIHVPSLRERREDIVPLAHQFLDALAERVGRPLALTSEAERALLAHSWPGNVRELRNAIERAVALTTTDFLTSKSFGLNARSEAEHARETTAHHPEAARSGEAPRAEPVRPSPPAAKRPAPEPAGTRQAADGVAPEDLQDKGAAGEDEPSVNESSGTLQEVIDRAAKARLSAALEESGGNRSAAARALDIDAATLARLIRRLGL